VFLLPQLPVGHLESGGHIPDPERVIAKLPVSVGVFSPQLVDFAYQPFVTEELGVPDTVTVFLVDDAAQLVDGVIILLLINVYHHLLHLRREPVAQLYNSPVGVLLVGVVIFRNMYRTTVDYGEYLSEAPVV